MLELDCGNLLLFVILSESLTFSHKLGFVIERNLEVISGKVDLGVDFLKTN